MEKKEDIGMLLKKRLTEAEKAPDDTLWNRIEDSLDKRDRKRRGVIWFWVGVSGLGLLLIILFTNGFFSSEVDTVGDVSTETEVSEKLKEQDSESLQNNEYTLPVIDENEKELEETEKIIANSEEKSTPTSSESEAENSTATKNTIKKKAKKDPYSDEKVIVETTYHYYNSDTKEAIETTDKSVIDSLMNQAGVLVDSVEITKAKVMPMKKKDSL